MRVAIVGAGPAGACLAWLLARRGLEVVLVERERNFARVFRGEGLMPTGLEALEQMGLAQVLAGLPRRPLECWDTHLERRLIMHVPEPTAALGERALCAVPPGQLIERILDAAAGHAGFALESPATFREIVREDGRVRGVRVATNQGERVLAADFVVGADGRASAVRSRAGLALEIFPEHYDVVWMKLPLPPELAGRSPFQIFASGPEVAFAYVSWDGRWQVGWLLEKGGWKEARSHDWLAECAALLPEPLERHLLAHRDALEGPSLLDVIVGRCPCWHAPGVLLIGDAAHPMSPIRAQGINLALRDAIVAANHLVPALEEGRDLAPACAAIQVERDPEIAAVQSLQLREARGQRWARERPWLMAPLMKLAPLLARTGLLQRAWLRQQAPLRFGVTKVELTV
jgi:2-polyprenyl-6-methoxyphenol hydroxylase-like FAD-dependent oxidoreductase